MWPDYLPKELVIDPTLDLYEMFTLSVTQYGDDPRMWFRGIWLSFRETKIRVDRSEAIARYSRHLFLSPGERRMQAVWLFPGSEVVLEIDGQEIWRKML